MQGPKAQRFNETITRGYFQMSHHQNLIRQHEDEISAVERTSFRLGLWLGMIYGCSAGAAVTAVLMVWSGK